jgi:hypothetical protein
MAASLQWAWVSSSPIRVIFSAISAHSSATRLVCRSCSRFDVDLICSWPSRCFFRCRVSTTRRLARFRSCLRTCYPGSFRAARLSAQRKLCCCSWRCSCWCWSLLSLEAEHGVMTDAAGGPNGGGPDSDGAWGGCVTSEGVCNATGA